MTVSNRQPDVRPSTTVRPTDDALLDGVVAVFGEHGFDRATVAELSVAAGVSKPTLYSRFGGKEQLFAACVRRESERLCRWMLESYRGAEGFGLRRNTDITTRALFDYAARHLQGFRLLYGSANRPHARRISDEVMAPVRATIAALIRIEHEDDDRAWTVSAEFCAAVVGDIAVRGVSQAVERDLDFTAAAELTISMIVAALRELDPAAARALDSAAGPPGSARREDVPEGSYPALTVSRPIPAERPGGRPPAATADEVLAATIQIFQTMDRFEAGAVATRLGISRTTLYRWFGSREGLLGAAFARQFEQLVLRIDGRSRSRGALRVAEVLNRATRAIAGDPALRRFLENESGAALRLVTRADGPVHAGSVAVIAALLERARAQDGYRPPVAATALAYALTRVGEAFLYDDTAADIGGRLDDLHQVTRTLLGLEH
ncbi:QsdR family transcriptional regulator [Nocardia sp. NPDC050712]|uniref:QsdR family transcriptional regulator n=1 Tax=Nocardia sp. NPDC050712 TaxID=3155518 RepID=UPI0033DF58B2